MTDAELLCAYADARSETAFALFVERRLGFVYATALRESGGDAHMAQEVAQEVFVLVAKNQPPSRAMSDLSGGFIQQRHMWRAALCAMREEGQNANTRLSS